ncbi:MAG: STAS domain-containing protein [Burkholderiaceae bacterium]|nr:STAS domain-containing protein [Burkholderiaceae bacterium]
MFQPTQTLTVENAESLLAQGLQAIAQGQNEIDLAQLTKVDSAGVATLLAWRRAAQAGKKPLQFVNLPANLRSLAELYGVAELLQAA